MIEIEHITDCLNHFDGLEAVVFDLDDTLYARRTTLGVVFMP